MSVNKKNHLSNVNINTRFNPVFTADFHSPNLRALPQNIQSQPAPRPILFSDEKYHGMRVIDFTNGPDFPILKQEFTELIDGIVDFVNDKSKDVNPPLSKSTVRDINDDFQEFKHHLFSGGYFDNHEAIMFGHGKELFHELKNLIDDTKLPLQLKVNTLMAIAPGMRNCSGGVLTALQEGISALQCHITGIKGTAYRVKVQMMESLILDFVSRSHRYKVGNEVHYVNAYFNHMAAAMGVCKRNDHFTSIAEPDITDQQLEACQNFVAQRISPMSVSRVMGASYLDQIKGAQKGDVNRPLKGGELTNAFNRIKDIKSARLNAEYGDVPENVLLFPSSDEYSYQIARQPTLLSKHFIQKLKSNQLVSYSGDGVTLASRDENVEYKILGDIVWKNVDGAHQELSPEELMSISPKDIMHTLKAGGINQEEAGGIIRSITQHLAEAFESGDLEHASEPWLLSLADLAAEKIITPDDIQYAASFALNSRSMAALKALADAGVDIDRAPLPGDRSPTLIAAENNDGALLQMLINCGAVLSTERAAEMLHSAAHKGHTGVVKVLLNTAGLDINHTDQNGHTALMTSTHLGHAETVTALLEAGADIELRNSKDRSPLMIAALSGHQEVLDILIDKGAAVNATYAHGSMTVLMLAVKAGHTHILPSLLAAGADVNYCSPRDGSSAVKIAALKRNIPALEILLAAKADAQSVASLFTQDEMCFSVDFSANMNRDRIKKKIDIINSIAPHLSPNARQKLLNMLTDQHSSKVIFGFRRNYQNYQIMKKAHPDLYRDFKQMKQHLKSFQSPL